MSELRPLLVPIAFLLATTAHAASALRFERLDIAEASGDVKIAGDIDGDGRLDIVLGGLPGDDLAWYRWREFHGALIGRPQVEFTTDGALADIDGDGDPDVIAPDGSGGDLAWFENPRPGGDPAMGDWPRHPVATAGDWVKDVEAADFDGDGRMDIAARTPARLAIWFRQPHGGWDEKAIAGLALGEEGLASGDVDGDGATDILVLGGWLRNPSGAAAREPGAWRLFPVGIFSPAFKALVADLDGDGRNEIVTSSSEHRAEVLLHWTPREATGKWQARVLLPDMDGTHTLAAGDLDGDGDIDLVIGQMHTTAQRNLSVLVNLDGDGQRWLRQEIDSVGLHNGVVADIDGDGRLDIFGSNWAGNPPLRLWLNRTGQAPKVAADNKEPPDGHGGN